MRRLALIGAGVTALLLAVAYSLFPIWVWLAGADHHFGGIEWDNVLVVDVFLLAIAALSFVLASRTKRSGGPHGS